jgi:hypothetical protein
LIDGKTHSLEHLSGRRGHLESFLAHNRPPP